MLNLKNCQGRRFETLPFLPRNIDKSGIVTKMSSSVLRKKSIKKK